MNIYVSNLSWGTSSESLRDLFAQFGEVSSAHVITDRETGRSRGFGFVEMPDDEAGRQAIDGINGHEFEGKVLTVNVARPRTERPVGQLRRQSRQWRRFRRRLQPQAVLIPERTVAAVRLFRSGAYGVPGKTPIGSRQSHDCRDLVCEIDSSISRCRNEA